MNPSWPPGRSFSNSKAQRSTLSLFNTFNPNTSPVKVTVFTLFLISSSHGSDNSVTASMTPEVLTDIVLKRERSRSPRRRSRSPRRSRRSYSPRSRSRSREDYRRTDRRSRSPMTGVPGAYSGSSYGRGGPQPPTRSFEERAQAKEQMMASVRESSQQERRVYVGNLSYDVKWHHLKDFMRQGEIQLSRLPALPVFC